MRAFVCDSNITNQQITGQRCLMKMHTMAGGRWREEGGGEGPGTGLRRNAEASVSALIMLPRERAPKSATCTSCGRGAIASPSSSLISSSVKGSHQEHPPGRAFTGIR